MPRGLGFSTRRRSYHQCVCSFILEERFVLLLWIYVYMTIEIVRYLNIACVSLGFWFAFFLADANFEPTSGLPWSWCFVNVRMEQRDVVSWSNGYPTKPLWGTIVRSTNPTAEKHKQFIVSRFPKRTSRQMQTKQLVGFLKGS